MTEPASDRPEDETPRSVAEIRDDTERLRVEVGTTVAELTDRLDVPAKLRGRRDEALAAARRWAEQARGAVRANPGLAGGGAAVVVGALVLRRIRARRTEARRTED